VLDASTGVEQPLPGPAEIARARRAPLPGPAGDALASAAQEVDRVIALAEELALPAATGAASDGLQPAAGERSAA
jgi:hypothetical protein